MTNAEAIITDLANQHFIEDIIKNVSRGDQEAASDLAQDMYLDLLNKESDKIESMYADGTLNFYIIRMITNNIRSTNSPFYLTYKKFPHLSEELNYEI